MSLLTGQLPNPVEGYFYTFGVHTRNWMTKHTKRDVIWSASVRLAERGKFTIENVLETADLNESSKRTARDVVMTMVELGHLETATYKFKPKPHGSGAYERRIWHEPGEIPPQWAIGKPNGEVARIYADTQENHDISILLDNGSNRAED